jgi:hypothetical protein
MKKLSIDNYYKVWHACSTKIIDIIENPDLFLMELLIEGSNEGQNKADKSWRKTHHESAQPQQKKYLD